MVGNVYRLPVLVGILHLEVPRSNLQDLERTNCFDVSGRPAVPELELDSVQFLEVPLHLVQHFARTVRSDHRPACTALEAFLCFLVRVELNRAIAAVGTLWL